MIFLFINLKFKLKRNHILLKLVVSFIFVYLAFSSLFLIMFVCSFPPPPLSRLFSINFHPSFHANR